MFSFKKTMSELSDEKGFTLVELMVVVAIIGILSAVAIPNFRQYQAKTKTSEAKLQLASIYSAETSMFADWDTYATCLGAMGYSPVPRGYYVVGFTTDNTTLNLQVRNLGGTCPDAQSIQVPSAPIQVGSQTLMSSAAFTTGNLGATAVATATTFTAGAVGWIDATFASRDAWTISQTKLISNTVRGYQ